MDLEKTKKFNSAKSAEYELKVFRGENTQLDDAEATVHAMIDICEPDEVKRELEKMKVSKAKEIVERMNKG
ncbi:MAG: hypothetical protein IKJ32_06120 [Clostridia bacterium]|nr:hypothetical protein [Clostridia bacterium]